jgi:hypothetical protein
VNNLTMRLFVGNCLFAAATTKLGNVTEQQANRMMAEV